VRGTASFSVGKYVPATSSALRPPPLDELREYGDLQMFRGKRVLDVGTGDGRIALGLAPYADESIGLDPDPEAIASARERARGLENVRFEIGAAQKLPFPADRFDVVVLSWAL
jgi:ubiquinone/menaquinone biosynthesis C-methylase UbiE